MGEFPNPPAGQVLDIGDRLGSERRGRLESELRRLRSEYNLDVMVVLWTGSLPPSTGLEDLARRLGETWAREDLWAVVLHVPDSLHRPAVASGGSFLETVTEQAAFDAQARAIFRGTKERTPNAQVEALALELGEEFVFLQHRRDYERKGIVAAQDEQLRAREDRQQAMIVRAIIATLFALLAVALVAVLYFFKRRPSNLAFPDTRWRRRLGAKWCGGNPVVVSIPSRTP